MKKLLLTGIAALFLATGTAHADPLPDIYLGRWCLDRKNFDENDAFSFYRFVPTEEEEAWKACQARDEHMEIKRSGFERYEDSCKFVSVKYTGEKMPTNTKPRKEDWVPVVRITAHCYVEGRTYNKVQMILKYLKGGGLLLENKAEVPTQYRGLWCWSKDTNAQHRCRKSKVDESSRSIGRDYIEVTEANENSCSVIAVKRTTNGHRVHMACSDGPIDVDLWFDARGRLHNVERKQ